jgi:hypothetical protein
MKLWTFSYCCLITLFQLFSSFYIVRLQTIGFDVKCRLLKTCVCEQGFEHLNGGEIVSQTKWWWWWCVNWMRAGFLVFFKRFRWESVSIAATLMQLILSSLPLSPLHHLIIRGCALIAICFSSSHSGAKTTHSRTHHSILRLLIIRLFHWANQIKKLHNLCIPPFVHT